MSDPLDLSIVVPVFNERDNIAPLVADIVREAVALGKPFEVILVNDGSTDGSGERLDEAAGRYEQVKVIHFAYNCGQTLALAAGMDAATGRVIVPMDGDRQNDPADIGRLVAKLDEGYACVSGWRKDRQDAGLRRWVSRVANRLIHRLSRVPVHDLGCTLKAYRADAIDPRELFGEMHRFLPLYVMARGGQVGELVVAHHPRTAGESKYGFGRIHRVISDVILVRVLLNYRTRPSHVFAKMAQAFFLLGVVTLVFVGFLGALVLWANAVTLLAVGTACELVMRNRYVLSGQTPWVVARTVNF